MATTKQEQQWQAQDDALTMVRYQEILQDKAQDDALKEANKQAAELNRRASAMKSAANIRATGGSISRSGGSKKK